MVSVDFDHAHRTALLDAIDRDGRFDGWQRAIRGTCGACAALATGPSDGLLFEVHPGCQCVSEPIVRGRSPEEALPDHTESWTPEDFAAVQKYVQTADSYVINAHVRGVQPGTGMAADAVANSKLTEAQLRVAVQQLDGLIDRAGPLGTKVRVTRVAGAKLKDAGLTRRKMPYTVTDKGFGSTASLGPEGIVGPGVRFDLDIDPRVKGIWGSNPSERELLPPARRPVCHPFNRKRPVG